MDCAAHRSTIVTSRATAAASVRSVPNPAWYGCVVASTAGSLSATMARASGVGDLGSPASAMAIARPDFTRNPSA